MSQNRKISEEEIVIPVGVGGIIMIVTGAVLLLSSVSYTPTDLPLTPMKWLKGYSLSVDPILPRKNIFGPLGAFIGFIQLQMFGAATFLLSIGLILLGGTRIFFNRRETIFVWVGLLGSVGCLSGLLGCQVQGGLVHWANGVVLTGAGGILGQLVGEFLLVNILATAGASILLFTGYLVSLSLFCNIQPSEFLFGLGQLCQKYMRRLQNSLDARMSQKRRFRGSFATVSEKPDSSDSAPLRTQSLFSEEELISKNTLKNKDSFSDVIKKPPEEDSSSLHVEASSSSSSSSRSEVELPSFKEEGEPLIIDGTAKKVLSEQVRSQKPFAKKAKSSPQQVGLTTDGFENYELPGFDLLSYDDSPPSVEANRSELLEMQRVIVETLSSFGVDVTPGDITRGPTITRFEVYPSVGLKVSRISALEADIARVTKAESINILAPIPGKDTVGIEVANANRVLVPFSEILLDEQFRSSKRRIPLALGKNVYGEAVIGDLAAMPHCLVAGATGAGKSVCINTIIASILYKFGPDELRFIMVDPKVVEMQMYSQLPHLVVPVITDPQKVVGALKWCVNEMERRYKLFAGCKVRNFDGFNSRERPPAVPPQAMKQQVDLPVDHAQIDSIAEALESGELGAEKEHDEEMSGFPETDEEEVPDRLPYIVIIIDELADLMQTAPADVELCIARIAQKARAAGMHLIVATQTPRADVVTGIIKANIPSRIAFQVSSKIDSRVILDTGGAEKLVGKGDMLFLPPGSAKLERSQGAFVSDEEVDQIVAFCSHQVTQQFEEEVQRSIETGGDAGGNGGEDEVSVADEELVQKCLEIVIQEDKASTSLLQRRLRLGYTRAARIVDIMEQRGYVGPADGAKPREVFAGK